MSPTLLLVPDLTSLAALLALLAALGFAAERLVEIIKNLPLIGPWLKEENPDPATDSWRRIVLQLLAVGAGIATTFLAAEVLPVIKDTFVNGDKTKPGALLVIGLLASGGSGFWNTLLGYINGIRDIKKTLASNMKVQAAAANLALAEGAAPSGGLETVSLKLSTTSPLPPAVQEAARKKLEDVIAIASRQ